MGIFNRLKNLAKANSTKEARDPYERTLMTIQVGDIVSIDHEDYEVEGRVVFNDDGWKWNEYKLKYGRATYWLSVEEDDDIEIALYKEIKPFTTEPFKTTEYEGVKYHLQEGSDAIVYDVEGKINLKNGMPVDYFEYSDLKDEKYLTVEIWDGEVEMSTGIPLEDFQIEIYPGQKSV